MKLTPHQTKALRDAIRDRLEKGKPASIQL
jgi:hypothetical protein